MKATQRDFNATAVKAARQCRIFFFCGPDEAGASAAAAKITAALNTPGERIEMGGSDLRRDPVRLSDEARSTSLFGDARHLFVRASGDETHDALKILTEAIDSGEAKDAWPVLIVATSATDKSRSAKLLAGRDDALVAMFYPPDLRSVTADVRSMADAAGLRLNGDLAERIARSAGLDVRLAQSEVNKLALYLDASPQAPRLADAEALDAVGASTEEEGFMPLVNAALAGDGAKLPGELKRMRELGLNPVGLLLALERRAAQLAALAAKLGHSSDVNGLLEAEQKARRIFWKDRADLAVQLRNWRGRKLDRLVARLVETHRALLADNRSAELLLAQALAEITRAAAPRR
ncbi:DNA polymerase III subunit delta [Altericroceibacterium spongiae]|uniref:DNA-directed DNA polymerase n=1 Tax=Altericroceibacterium spongiae TaxID=2320269 RepID=A0A420EPA4_9SPHN|nr:DNA polymerase III subunit delta [Altericroceibacterium spongiae]RKF22509.1 DNA polymerase III subunit delta [Altericroceibacterium spongiae]